MSYLSKSGIGLLSETEKQKTPIGVFDGVSNYISVTPDETTTVYNFASDSDGSAPQNWEPLSGSFTVQSASPSIFGGAKYMRCDGAGSIKIPNIVANGVYEFDLYKSDTANAIAVSFIDNTTTGYTLNILNTEAISLSKIGSTTLLSSAASYVANATWYRFKVVRNEANVFSVYIKSSVTGNYVLVSVSGGSGTNPVTDATTLTSKYFSVTMGLNDCIANVNISAAVGQFDLNGYERITNSQNRDFEADTTDWVGTGNHSAARSAVDKKAGTYSLLVTSTGVGDGTSNYIQLPAASLNPIESAKKFTIEAWARATNANCQITMAIGNQTKTFTTISTVAGTFTKLVWNFLATANEVGVPLRIFANQADQIYLDQLSVTQAYDLALQTSFRCLNTNSLSHQIFSNEYSAASYTYMLFIANTQQIATLIKDGNTAYEVKYGAAVNDGKIHNPTVIIDRVTASSLKVYNKGILLDANDITNYGKLNPTNIQLGDREALGEKLYGTIQDLQLLRFSDIASSTFNAATVYQNYLQTGKYPQVTGGGATVIFDSAINDGNGYQIKDKSAYKKHGVLGGTLTEFWNNKPLYFEQEYTFKSSEISASSATTALLKLPANVKIIEYSYDIEKFSSDVTLSFGYSGSDAWLGSITGTNVNVSSGATVDKGYSSLVEKQLYIKKSAATTYGRIKLRLKFEYIKEL